MMKVPNVPTRVHELTDITDLQSKPRRESLRESIINRLSIPPLEDYRKQERCEVYKEAWACECFITIGVMHMGTPFLSTGRELEITKCENCVEYDARTTEKMKYHPVWCDDCVEPKKREKVAEEIKGAAKKAEKEALALSGTEVKKCDELLRREARDAERLNKKWNKTDETSGWYT